MVALARRAVAQGRHQRQRPARSARCAWTATATRCWPSSSRPGRPATRARARASSPATSSRRRPTRRCPAWSARSTSARATARRAPTPSSCSTTRRGSGPRSRRRPRRSPAPRARRSDDRVDEEAADVLYHLTVLLAQPRAHAGRRRGGARWPPSLRRPTAPGHPVAGRGARARGRPQPRPAAPHLHRRLRDARLGLPQAARRHAGAPAFLLESAEQGQRVGRWSFIGVRPRRVLRWSLGDGGDPYALARDAVAEHRQAQLPGLPPFAGGAVGFFGYDLVRTVEPLGDPNPTSSGCPTSRSCSPTCWWPSTTSSTRSRSWSTSTPTTSAAWRPPTTTRVATIAKARRLLAGPLPAAAAHARPAAAGVPLEPAPASSSRGWWRGSSSTSTPATPSRSCPRSAGARSSTSTRSRSTAACASSTRARTCTSWTSWTSRSRARRPSRC